MKFAESGKRGPITYAENILREGLKYKPETYTLEDETGTKQYKAFLISCANASQYGNNAYIAPQASMSDGLMDVVIMEPFDVIEAASGKFRHVQQDAGQELEDQVVPLQEAPYHPQSARRNPL